MSKLPEEGAKGFSSEPLGVPMSAGSVEPSVAASAAPLAGAGGGGVGAAGQARRPAFEIAKLADVYDRKDIVRVKIGHSNGVQICCVMNDPENSRLEDLYVFLKEQGFNFSKVMTFLDKNTKIRDARIDSSKNLPILKFGDDFTEEMAKELHSKILAGISTGKDTARSVSPMRKSPVPSTDRGHGASGRGGPGGM